MCGKRMCLHLLAQAVLHKGARVVGLEGEREKYAEHSKSHQPIVQLGKGSAHLKLGPQRVSE